MALRFCIVCKARLSASNYSNYCGIHTVDSSIAIVLQQGEIAVQKEKIDAVIALLDNYEYADVNDAYNVGEAIEMLEDLKND